MLGIFKTRVFIIRSCHFLPPPCGDTTEGARHLEILNRLLNRYCSDLYLGLHL